MEDAIEQWLIENGIIYRRADDMPARLDFFLPTYNIYIECKRYHTPRTNEQLERAPDIIVVQGYGCLKFLKALTSRERAGPSPAARPTLHLPNRISANEVSGPPHPPLTVLSWKRE